MQDQFSVQSEMMSQNNKNIEKNTAVITELQDQFGGISEMMSQNNKNIEKNTAVTAKSHQTISQSYSHFSDKTENFNIFQPKNIIDIEYQIKDLKELVELGQHDNISLNRQIAQLRHLIIIQTEFRHLT